MTTSGTPFSPDARTGDIVLLPYPFTDHAGAKKRPVLVVAQADGQGDFVAVPVTSSPGHLNAISLQQPDMAAGALPKPSWIKAEQPYTSHVSLIVKRFGSVKPTVLSSVRTALGVRLGLVGDAP